MPRSAASRSLWRAKRMRLACAVGMAIGCYEAAHADHFSGATITYECLSGNQYRIYLDLYLDCAGSVITPHALNFSNNCGISFSITGLTPVSVTEVSPLCPTQVANSSCNGGALPSFKKYRFQTTLFLSPCNKWTIDWYTCCRNTTQNINLTPGMYVVATLNNSGGLCDRSPTFIDVGVPYVCVNQPVAYNLGVVDPDGNTMSFALVSARFATPAPMDVTYQSGMSGPVPIPGITINPFTGQLTFTPTAQGYYVVVVEVKSFTPGGVLIGTVMRDLMFSVVVCDGTPPATSGISSATNNFSFWPSQFIACPGSLCFSLVFSDPQAGQALTVTSNATSVLPGATFSVTGTNPATATVCWTVTGTSFPINIWFQVTDNACPIANTMSFAISAVDCSFLPVELLSLTAGWEGSEARVHWETATEQDSWRFTVERSADGLSFAPLGTVDAAGNSQSIRSYSWLDRAPLPVTGYYRIVETALDGSSWTSPVVALPPLERPVPEALLVGPSEWLIAGSGAQGHWVLYDAVGRTTAQGALDPESGARITTGSFGPHLLRVETGGRSFALTLPGGLGLNEGIRVRGR